MHAQSWLWAGVGLLIVVTGTLIVCVAIWVAISDNEDEQAPEAPYVWMGGFLVCVLYIFFVGILHYDFQAPMLRYTQYAAHGIQYELTGTVQPISGHTCQEIAMHKDEKGYSMWPKTTTSFANAAGHELKVWVESVHVSNKATVLNVATKTWDSRTSATIRFATGAYMLDSDGVKYEMVGDCGTYNLRGERTLAGNEIYKWSLVFSPLSVKDNKLTANKLTLRLPQFEDVDVALEWGAHP